MPGGIDAGFVYDRHRALDRAATYLRDVASDLRAGGVGVEAHAVSMGDPAYAIEEAARMYRADAVACATHGRGVLGRLLWGSVARRVLVHSAVPVLLRHVEDGEEPVLPPEPETRRILVPLDRSAEAEAALPLASALAARWNAAIRLVHVIPNPRPMSLPESGSGNADLSHHDTGAAPKALAYLKRLAMGLPAQAEVRILSGPVVDRLVVAGTEWEITDVVMTSHGRTGLARVILGSVADGLIQRLYCPVIVTPSLVPRGAEANTLALV
jgi:nucleotide-binding universal stress UspA family protein